MAFGFGLALPRAKNGFAGPYIVNGFDPTTVTDFTNNYFRSGGTQSTFASLFDYTGASTKTMTDSDGKLKWGPHNLLLQSAALNTASWALQGATTTASTLTEDTTTGIHRVIQTLVITAGTPITFRATVSASATRRLYLNLDVAAGIRILYEFNTGSVVNTVSGSGSIVNNGNGTFTITASGVATGNVSGNVFLQLNRASSGNATDDSYLGDGVSGLTITNMHVFRSDLGGMVNNPDTGNSYVPTTTSAVYLPRRGNHLYNGYAWVNKGLLLESQARTNLILQSNTFNTTWGPSANMTVTPAATVSPDGNTNGWLWTRSATSSVYLQQIFAKAASPITYTASFYVKKSVGDYCALRVQGNYPSRADVIFNLAAGTISTAASVSTNFTSPSASIQNAGNGWYRVSLTSTSDSITSIIPIISFNSNNVQVDGTDSVSNSAGFIYGAQFEQAATPSSYIPTTTAQVTRAAELLQVKAPNLAVGANDFTNTTYWPAPNTINGLTFTRTAGSDGTGPYIDVRIAGVATSTGNDVIFVSTPSRTSASIGDTFTCGAVIQRVAGTLTGFSGIGCSIAFETAPSTFVSYASYTLVTSTSPTLNTVTSTVASGNQVKPAIIAAFTNGATVDVTYRIRGFQFDRGASRVTYPDQSNLSMQIDGTMTGTPSTFTRWGGASTAYLLQSASSSVYSFAQYGGELQTVTGGSFTSGINVPFNVASRHGANYINGAVNGTALTASSSTLPFPVLNASPIQLGPTFMGNIGDFRQWNTDVGNAGIVAASAAIS